MTTAADVDTSTLEDLDFELVCGLDVRPVVTVLGFYLPLAPYRPCNEPAAWFTVFPNCGHVGLVCHKHRRAARLSCCGQAVVGRSIVWRKLWKP